MSSLVIDIVVVLFGLGIFFVCLAWAVKIISEVRTQSQITRDVFRDVPDKDDVELAFKRRLQELNTNFGRMPAIRNNPIDITARRQQLQKNKKT